MKLSPTTAMYFIAIVLPPELDTEIKKYKAWMLEQFGCKVGSKSPAHITLVPPYWMDISLETSLLSDLYILAKDVEPFTITTLNFSSFKQRTLFIDVFVTTALKDVKSTTDSFFKERPQYKIKEEKRPYHPHITIATRDLSKKDFYEAWEHFKDTQFNKVFTASGLSLLRHNGMAWDVILTTPFAAKQSFSA
jgi:2'-5' RNA ligase